MKASNHSTKQRTRRRRAQAYSHKNTALWLLLCFPMGLYRMWKNSRWPIAVKSLVSILIFAILVAIVLPVTQPPERYIGGVELLTNEDMLIGPTPPEGFERISMYSYNVTADSVLAEPEPTPVPIYVYCNDGGKFYHSKECTYVKATSNHCSLLQALDAGYKKCAECDAPAEY